MPSHFERRNLQFSDKAATARFGRPLSPSDWIGKTDSDHHPFVVNERQAIAMTPQPGDLVVRTRDTHFINDEICANRGRHQCACHKKCDATRFSPPTSKEVKYCHDRMCRTSETFGAAAECSSIASPSHRFGGTSATERWPSLGWTEAMRWKPRIFAKPRLSTPSV